MALAKGAGEARAVNIHKKGKKGQLLPFDKTQDTPFNDGTCYIYAPRLYQEIINFENCYPEDIAADAATKLRKISFVPTTQAQKNVLTGKVSLSPSVEEIIIKDCESETSELNLETQTRLKKLNTLGSTFTAYVVADGAPLEEFKVE
jgi:hypothetical protein